MDADEAAKERGSDLLYGLEWSLPISIKKS